MYFICIPLKMVFGWDILNQTAHSL